VDEVKRSKVYLDAAKKVATQSHSPTQDGHRGHRSVLGNIGHSLFGNPSQQKEGVAKTILGVVKRKLAEKFVIILSGTKIGRWSITASRRHGSVVPALYEGRASTATPATETSHGAT
jgi:hypothetical protein